MRADGLRLRQVLTNLAGNAVKFTDQGGVCVTVERGERGAARFSVIDTGPGVPADRRAAIFDSFEQGDGSHARRFEGAGLGLAISRELVRLMGGELTLADNPGGGSIFAFAVRLPECAAVEPVGAPGDEAAAPRRDARAHHRPFAVRGAGDGGAARGSGRQRRTRRRPRLRPRGAERLAPSPTSSSSIARSGPRRPIGWLKPRARPGVRRSLVLFSPFERRAFGQTALKGFDGWLVKPVRARSLFERVAWDSARRRRPCVAALAASASVRRALIAEDNDINALIAQKALRRLGFEVVRAHDGEEALRLASPIAPLESRPVRRHPDGPQDAGARRIRGDAPPAAARGRLRLVADADRRADRQRPRGKPALLRAAGFDAFLVKPVDFRALAATVERVCAARARPGASACGRHKNGLASWIACSPTRRPRAVDRSRWDRSRQLVSLPHGIRLMGIGRKAVSAPVAQLDRALPSEGESVKAGRRFVGRFW